MPSWCIKRPRATRLVQEGAAAAHDERHGARERARACQLAACVRRLHCHQRACCARSHLQTRGLGFRFKG